MLLPHPKHPKLHVKRLFLNLFLAQSLCLTAQPAATGFPRMNVVFILADDLGWRDLGYMGSDFCETPNLDALSKKGTVFTRAYSANPLCSPTRASILTGLYPARIGITFPNCHFEEEILEKGLESNVPATSKWIGARSLTRLKTSYYTMAEAFGEAGYATSHFGKWHLGKAPYDPLSHGFSTDFPKWSWAPGPGKYLAPWRWGVNGSDDKGGNGEHIEDRTTAQAIEFMEKNRDRPFLMHYWAWSVHGPHEGKPNLVEKYRKKANPKSPQKHPYYGAMVETLDDNVGKLLDAIAKLGLEQKTIIVFCSDNGGIHFSSKQVLPDLPVTSNAPLRGGKATIYEGGTRVPCIVYWPGVTRPGAVSEEMISSIDWFPTLLDMTGVSSTKIPSFDGVSIVPVLKGGRLARDTIYCHFPQGDGIFTSGHQPSTYVIQKQWKLIRFYCDNPDQSDRFELYNLSEDVGEANDLSRKYPERVEALHGLMQKFLAQSEAVIPVKNPRYALRTEAVGGRIGGGTQREAVLSDR